MPRTAVDTSSEAADPDQIQKPTQATDSRPEPIQAARASLPRSMKRPTPTAMKTGRIANVAEMMPSQTGGRSSSMTRYDVVTRTSEKTVCTTERVQHQHDQQPIIDAATRPAVWRSAGRILA